MKTKMSYRRGCAALAAMFILAACGDLTGTGSGEAIPDGMGLVHIRLNAGAPAQSLRTAVPSLTTYYFTLTFTAPGETTVTENIDGNGNVTVALQPATWTLEVKGYADSGRNNLKVTGGLSSVPVTAGTASSFDVYLTPGFSAGGTGSLSYSIGLPAGVRAWLGLYPIDETPGTSQDINISSSAGGTATSTLSALPEGAYRAVIDLYDRATNSAAVLTEAVHIYAGLDTPLNYSFTGADFAACPPEVGDGVTTLAGKLDAALASPAGSYTIILDGTETDLSAFAPKTLSVTDKNISIAIRGMGHKVQVALTGTPLFTLEADYSSLSLTLHDLTLNGRSGNSAPVVQVNRRGTLSMKAGSLITGNSSGGGGVYVSYNGSFAMSGGAVSGNTGSNGGGVSVYEGSFAMSGGAVSGNSSSSSYYGGGVYVTSGSFAMSGGAVSGNSSSSGGGVFVRNQGIFAMSGGAVSGNSSSSGGGVSVDYGSFAMSGGTVSGNMFSDSNFYGREVFVNGGTFKISGSARPERVFLSANTQYITIDGPLSRGAAMPIDLGVRSSAPITSWENARILRLDSSYSGGDLASLKKQFSLGNTKMTESPYTETPITGYTINNNGEFVAVTP
jgi:hypothetical protein